MLLLLRLYQIPLSTMTLYSYHSLVLTDNLINLLHLSSTSFDRAQFLCHALQVKPRETADDGRCRLPGWPWTRIAFKSLYTRTRPEGHYYESVESTTQKTGTSWSNECIVVRDKGFGSTISHPCPTLGTVCKMSLYLEILISSILLVFATLGKQTYYAKSSNCYTELELARFIQGPSPPVYEVNDDMERIQLKQIQKTWWLVIVALRWIK